MGILYLFDSFKYLAFLYKTMNIYGKSREEFPIRERKKLLASSLSEKNKELILEFLESLASQNSGLQRQAKLSSQLRRLAVLLEVDFDQARKKDIQGVVAKINSSEDLAEATKADYRRCLKQFYSWFKEEDERLYCSEEGIRLKTRQFYSFLEGLSLAYKKNQIDPSTVVTEKDLEKILASCSSLRDIAFLSVIHESGCRISEMLGMKLCDLDWQDSFLKISVDGKTGRRTIPLLCSIPALSRWLETHPFRQDSSSYLWLGERKGRMYNPLQYAGAKKLLERAFRRSELKKRYNPHWFRHSRASLLAPKLTEAMLCKYMGWSLGSRQVKAYVQLCSNQLDDAYLSLQGLIVKKEEKISSMLSCSCGAPNLSSDSYCFKCGRPLSMDVILKDETFVKKEMDKSVSLLMEVMKNPELMRRFEEFKMRSDIKFP